MLLLYEWVVGQYVHVQMIQNIFISVIFIV